MEAAVHVRPGDRGDVAFILEQIRGLAEYERLTDQVSASEAALAEHLFGARPFAEAIIGEVDGRRAGYALFFHNYSTFLTRPGIFLEDLYVMPELRRLGVGRALLAHVVRLAAERGCGRVEWAVLDWNAPAIAFYRSLGAEPVDGWTIHRLTGARLEAVARSR
jgi:GNAT superfamily N-acetyltransferase